MRVFFVGVAGVGFATRQIGKRTTSWEDIKQEGDTWSLDITSTFKNSSLKFKLGEEFNETTLDGRQVKVRDYFIVYNFISRLQIFFLLLLFYAF